MTQLNITNPNILITGGAGFIGSHLANALFQKGYNVTVLDNLALQIHGNNPGNTSATFKTLHEGIKFIHGSVTNKIQLSTAIQDQQIIVHFAAETGTGQSMYAIQRYTETNVNGTALLLELLTQHNHSVTKLIVASSRAVYGEGKYRAGNDFVYPVARKKEDMERGDFDVKSPASMNPLQCVATDENSKLHPSSVYGITKQNQEQLVMAVCPALNIAPVSLRYQNVYGPGQSLNNPYTGILSIFSTLIRNNQLINIFEDGNESRDFIFIDDVIDATIKAIESDVANGNIYNVGSGIPVNVLTVAQTLCRYFKANESLNVSGNFRVGDIRHNYADITKIQNELSFMPAYTFEKGIQCFVDWVMQQPLVKSKYDSAIEELKLHGLYK